MVSKLLNSLGVWVWPCLPAVWPSLRPFSSLGLWPRSTLPMTSSGLLATQQSEGLWRLVPNMAFRDPHLLMFVDGVDLAPHPTANRADPGE